MTLSRDGTGVTHWDHFVSRPPLLRSPRLFPRDASSSARGSDIFLWGCGHRADCASPCDEAQSIPVLLRPLFCFDFSLFPVLGATCFPPSSSFCCIGVKVREEKSSKRRLGTGKSAIVGGYAHRGSENRPHERMDTGASPLREV